MKRFFLQFIWLVILIFTACPLFFAQQKQLKLAPELKKNLTWLNTDKPLSLSALRGKIVLLDFWTYGCINCIHIIPNLKKLEAKYKNQLVVIGVHSAKFTNERESENIRRIILRFELEHPVVNDADLSIWNAYRVEGYPTEVLINPDGEIIVKAFGEGQFRMLDRKIAEIADDFRAKGKLDETPRTFALEKNKFADSPLAFPGKVLADAESNRLFIADTNHNRIVVTKLDGTLLTTVGNGRAARDDGDFGQAAFNHPQGMALAGNFLYVADTGNHLIRRVDFNTKKVETVAGTGAQVYQYKSGGNALDTPLNSPWDLQIIGERLFVAMAGNHQIWLMDLRQQTIAPFAGNGIEERKDGNLAESSFAQSSGLASDGKNLYVADAESNTIRKIDLEKGTVKTLAGGNLFDFGDRNGTGDEVRLQHPLGLAFWGKNILLADTYNHRIKILNPNSGTVKNFSGDGKSGIADGEKPRFYEPGGLSAADGKLFVADTNNHAIRVVDLTSRQVTTLKISGLTIPK